MDARLDRWTDALSGLRLESQSPQANEELPDLVLTLDASGELRELHAGGELPFGLEARAVVGRNLSDLLAPAIWRSVSEAIGEVMLRRSCKRLRLSTGRGPSTRAFEASLSPLDETRILAIVHETTFLERRERERRTAEAILHAAFSTIPFDFWVSDESAVVTWQNPASIEHWGDIRGTDIRQHPPDPSLASSWATDFHNVMSGRAVHVERSVQDESGEPLFMREVLAPLVQDGKTRGAVGVRIDITDLRLAEQELKKVNANLEERVRQRTVELEAANAELESFSFSVSHDLRAPLRAIDGYSQVLIEDFGPTLGQEGAGYIDKIRQACKRMGNLIEDLLSLSRCTRQKLDKVDLDLTWMARDILEGLARLDPSRATDLRIEEGIRVHADATLMRSVLENLLGNAWKFTSKRDRARVGLSTRRDEEGRTWIEISDNGAGFDMAQADKLFGTFQRLHDAKEFPGTGIGLATVKRIVVHHGGCILAEGTQGEGAVFRFFIPPA